MPTVTYDDRSFKIDDQRVWLVSGSVHYFRIPAELWADRLLKAKRAGLNCISTYVPWNFHEPDEGRWLLSGDHDVAGFIQVAGELGLYVILRPGPYICAEWDFGGLPGWLTGKAGLSYRTSNAAFSHYFDKYFAKVLPPLAELQVSRGGNIILVQNENEYYMTTMPERLQYLSFINQLIRRAGFDVPIINCNLFSDPAVPENVECVNTWSEGVSLLKRMRLRRPDQPLLVTEFWPGWFDNWGGKHETRSDVGAARRALEVLGCGAQYNYYMFHGGTNFGFWGCRNGAGEGDFQTTSYDYDAPLAEGGGLTEKYYLTKLVNMLATHMGPQLASCAMEEPGLSVHDSTDVLNMYGPAGRWAVVTNNGNEAVTEAEVSLPEGKRLTVSLEPLGAVALPIDLRLPAGQVLDYSNLMPLGLFAETVLVLHGPSGFGGRVGIDGRELTDSVPKGDEVKVVEHQGLSVVIINSDLARRTWFVEDTLVFGPRFVGETLEDIVAPPGGQYSLLSMEGKLSRRKVKASVVRKAAVGRLGKWTRSRVCSEPTSKDLDWEKLDKPTDLDRLGVHHGYAWYQIRVDSPRPRKRYLFFPDCADRATVYVNGKLIGVWGVGDGAGKAPMPANFRRGENAITALVDNLGRLKIGSRIGELKGLFGHIHDARPLRTNKFKVKKAEGFSKRIVPRPLAHIIDGLQKLPVYTAELAIPLTKVTPIHMSIAGLPYHAAVVCNERTVAFLPRTKINYGSIKLASELKRGKNTIRMLLWGDVRPKALDCVKFHTLNENLSEKAKWFWRRWELPTGKGLVVGKDQPAWYVAKFRHNPRSEPLFLHILNAKKGQVFLNGHNVGRFWSIGPQQRYYLPENWLAEENELLVFEERGVIPSGSRLEFRPGGPYRD